MKLVKRMPFSRYAILAFLVSLWTLASFAQTPTGQITGRITDASGAVIPGAQVTVTNVDTQVKREMASNDVGYYVFTLLPPGTYRIDVQKVGFQAVTQEGFVLTVDQVARVDIPLTVGALTQKVVVTAAAPLLATDSGAVGTLVDPKRVQELPLQGRNPYALSELVPGVRFNIGWQALPVDMNNDQYLVVNGTQDMNNLFLIDGISNNDERTGGPNLFPSPDSIQEFRLETNSLNAEYGRAAGGVFNVVTKSGTNQLHGSAWEYNRVRDLDANDFFVNRAGNPRPPLTFNQFGSSLGGPIRKDKTFFFGSWELAREHQGVVLLGQVPTAAQRTGNFSSTYNSAGQLVTIYDPLTNVPNPNAPGQYLRSPFPNNTVPLNRQNSVSLALQNYIPLPNTTGAAYTGANNYISAAPTISDKDVFMVKVDHHFTAKNQITGSFHYDLSPWDRSNFYGNIGTPTYGPQTFSRRGIGLEDTYLVSPTTILSFRYGYSRTRNLRVPYSYGYNETQLGLPASYINELAYGSLPQVTVAGFSSSANQANIGNGALIGASDIINFASETHSLNVSITMVRGKHNFKTGFEGWLDRDNNHQVTQNTFSAAAALTEGPNPLTATSTGGYGYATYLLGLVGGTTSLYPSVAAQDLYFGGYFQDTFRVMPKLTLNYGLRYDYLNPRTDRFNQLTNFNWNGAVPLTVTGFPNLHGVLEFPGKGGLSRGVSIPDRHNFAPRLGFSYQLTSKTVFRGGGGVYYSGEEMGADDEGFSGFSSASTVVTSIDGITPTNYFNNPFPQGLALPTGNTLGAATLLGQAVSFQDRHHPTPYTYDWNGGIQHEFPGSVLLDVAYVGSRGVKIEDEGDTRQFDQLPDADLALGSQLNTVVSNPFYGLISSGTLAQSTVTQGQLLLPYPQFQGVGATNMVWPNSIYHSLQVKVEKRMAKGFTLVAAYTYSKLLDDYSNGFAGEALGGGGIQDYNNLRGDWAVDPVDQTHNMVISYLWQLPFGPGQRYLSQVRGLTARFVEGWHIQGITAFASGAPLGMTTTTNTTHSYGGGQRANWSGKSAHLSNRTVGEWFDTSQFSLPATYSFGNSPRTLGDVRADGTKNFDFSMAKNIKVMEGKNLEFKAEFFNFFNTPRFGIPGTTYGSASFGVVGSDINQPRLIQLGLRFSF